MTRDTKLGQPIAAVLTVVTPPARYGDMLGHADIYCDIAGAGQAAGGPAWIHRPPEHPREQILLHGQEPGRGRETVRTLGGVRQHGV